MNQHRTPVRLFLSSPGDVEAERQHVHAVAARLNRIYGQYLGIQLEVIDWQTHVIPDMGRPQAVINQQIQDYDLFLGIMWKRFGTPTGVAESGTEEEFRIACQNWQEFRRPRILFYFSQAPFMPRTTAEIQQMSKVLAFQEELSQKGLVWEYPSAEQFPDIIFEHLAKILLERFRPQADATLPADFTPYLTYLKGETMYLDIKGLATGANKAHQFRIDKLFIPLKTSAPLRTSGRGRHGGPAMSAAEVPLQDALKLKRLLIKGDPGAGKTTFLRLLAFHLAAFHSGELVPLGATELTWPDPPPLPIFIRLGHFCEFIQHQQQNQPNECPPHGDSPGWLLRFLAAQSGEYHWQVTTEHFQQKLQDGACLILLDGLDEAPDEKIRRHITRLAGEIGKAYPQCQIVVTSRPAALEEIHLPAGFEPVDIAPLDDAAMQTFLTEWCHQLYQEAPEHSQRHLTELSTALSERPEIRRMARTPVMLTALAVVHWNENKLPEQRAELYKSIIGWLLRSREQKPGRLNARRCQKLLQLLALAMFLHPDGRQRQVGLKWAAEQLADKFESSRELSAVAQAEQFLREEMMDSGVIVERNRRLEFWHLSFQEYLAALEIGGLEDAERIKLLFEKERLYHSEWHEVLLLLAGVLYDQGEDKINHLFNAIIDKEMPVDQRLPELPPLARAVGLLGSMVRDLQVFQFQPENEKYPGMVQRVMGIFDKEKYKSVPLRTRIQAADTLGQVGDPRFLGDPANLWVKIPGGTFWIGAQNKNPKERNYDPNARDREAPVHQVKLSPFLISKYPVTVAQFRQFIEAGGYETKRLWKNGGFEKYKSPDKWNEQLEYPTRPIVNVSWFEAQAYANWMGGRLPTEAEWERAARGPAPAYRKYPWGNQEPESETANFDKTGIGSVTPVGIFPEDCSPEAVLELAGNVWEWCTDWYDNKYYQYCKQQGIVVDPGGPEQGSARVLRGGSFYSFESYLLCVYRNGYYPDLRTFYVGFRVVRRSES